MGRPKLPKRKISISVTIEEASKKAFKKYGEGNMSRGIEVVLKNYQECQKKLKECEEKMAERV